MSSPVQVRFLAKAYGKKWRVYDKVVASYPGERPGIGKFPTFASKEDCEAFAAEIDEQHRKSR